MTTRNGVLKTFEEIGMVIVILICLGVLTGAFFFQFYYKELPCPLCLLQRLGFIGIVFGLLLNLKFGYKPLHYSIALLSGIFTSFVALRQIVLHIIPGTGAYGSAFLGYHLYTWSFIVAMTVVILTSILLGFERSTYQRTNTLLWRTVVHVVFALSLAVVASNVVAIFFECGLFGCPDNPTQYQYRL